jgi:endonuclease/exonuclease/phosphatase family metal-dependent hydrolase
MIRLVCLNIERSKHLDAVFPFLIEQQPDVVCLQELFERDIPAFEKIVGPCRAYGVDGTHPADPPEEGSFMEGAAIFSRLPVTDANVTYYVGSEEHARTRDAQAVPDDLSLVSCTLHDGDETFRISTTHGFLTQKGTVTDEQLSAMRAMLKTLDDSPELILCGDFNAPRGKEAFAMLAAKYKDNIPLEYKTSIDVKLHRAGHLPEEKMDEKMVDGIFSTPGYMVSKVKLHSGVSDHLAITADISRAESA